MPTNFKDKTEIIKNIAEIAFFFFGVIWAINTFGYEAFIVPVNDNPQLIVSNTLEKMEKQGSLITLLGKITVRNTSKSRLKVLAAYYNVSGYKVTSAYRNQTSKDSPAPLQSADQKVQETAEYKNKLAGLLSTPNLFAARYYKEDEVTFIQSSNFLIDSWLESGEEYSENYLVYVPESQHDVARTRFDILVAREYQLVGYGSIDDVIKVDWVVQEDGKLNIKRWINPYCYFNTKQQKCWEEFNNQNNTHMDLVRDWGIVRTDASYDIPLLDAEKVEVPKK